MFPIPYLTKCLNRIVYLCWLIWSFLLQALDTFNAALVSPVYYAMFTTLTIIASGIMFKVNYLTIYLLRSQVLHSYKCKTVNVNWLPRSMLQDWSGQNASTIVSELCGFITVLSGTIILHSTREQQPVSSQGMSINWEILVWFDISLIIVRSRVLRNDCVYTCSYKPYSIK